MKLTSTIRTAFVNAVLADVPSIDYPEQIRALVIEYTRQQMPPALQALANDPACRPYLQRPNYSVYVPGFGRVYGVYANTHVESTPIEGVPELLDKLNEQHQRRYELKEKLSGVANSVSTVKALRDLMPELAKYLPGDGATVCRTLPALANLMTDLTAAGWPK